MANATPENTSVLRPEEPSAARDVDTVPFVEMVGNRLQGVVSSGSDVERVYCAFLEAASGAHYSSTNNNRPDAGTEKRLRWLIEAAVAQFGIQRVARFLQVPGDPERFKRPGDIAALAIKHTARRQEPAGTVFSRFLNYLRFVELPGTTGPVPEMSWFVAK
jgi:hypothetical protein